MENQNPVPPVQTPEVQPTSQVAIDAKNFKSKIKTLNESLRAKFKTLTPANKKIVILVTILFSIIFVLFILAALFGKKQGAPIVIVSPTPISVSPIPTIVLNASRYATDSGVLKIESDLNNFAQQLNISDVKQSDLNLPNLNFDINFNQ